MTRRPDHNSVFSADLPVNEADMLAFVEGEFDAAGAARIRAALAARPRALEALEAMRRDRAVMTSLPAPRAPRGMVAASIALADEIDANALRGLAVSAAPAELPRSRLIPRKAGLREAVLAVIGSSRARRVALAAGLLIATGVGVWQAAVALPGLFSSPPGPIARNDDGMEEPANAPIDHREIAILDPSDITGPPANEGPAEGPLTLAAEQLPIDAVPIDAARAAALASEGRLAIRIRSGEPAAAARRLATLASRGAGGATGDAGRLARIVWAPLIDDDARVLALRAPRPSAEPEVPLLPPDAVASDRERDGGAAPADRRSGPIDPEMLGAPGGFLLTLDGSERELGALAAALARETRGEAEFIELGSPHGVAAAPEPVSLLWWTAPASRWVERVSVPVIITR